MNLEFFKKPKAYTPNPEKFWDDEYISKQMLKAHLDPEFEGASRNHAFIQKSIEWIYSQIGKKETALLDLGCGPGLYSLVLAKKGWSVTGVDLSHNSIQYAKEQAENEEVNVVYHVQNYLEIDFENQFDAVILIYCDYAVLSPEERKILVGKIYKALKPGGKFILDVFTPAFYEEKKDNTSWEMVSKDGFWRSEPYAVLIGQFFYENQVVLDQVIVMTETEEKVYYLWNTFFTKESLMKEISPSLFPAMNFYGDVTGTPLSDSGKTLCLVATK